MSSKILALASAMAVVVALGATPALAGANVVKGIGNQSDFTNNGRVHINQNGNGCRAHCYGSDTTINGGWNNGNTAIVDSFNTDNSVKSIKGKGHHWGHFK